VKSDTLRAPVAEQSCRRVAYSSSESRTLIIRDRGFRIFMSDLDVGSRFLSLAGVNDWHDRN
jgi:hypothetical protein